MTTELSLVEDKFTVYVQKSCNPGPYLDATKVANLPDFFQENSVSQTIKNVIEAVVLAGTNFKETFDKVPAYLGHGSGIDIKITATEKDGKRKKCYYKLPVLDRKSKGEQVLEKFVGNLKCCSKFLSYNRRTCKECHIKQEMTPLKVEPTTDLSKKETTVSSPEMSKPKTQFTVYCRRNCKVGPLLDPDKIKKLPTSFSGSLPKIIQKLVPVIVLSGYNPSEAIKHVPSSQGRCILVKVKIGKLEQMCLVHNICSTVKFWCFLKKLRLAFGMCENFFSEKPPKKSSCKKCRKTDVAAGYFSSDDDDDFQDLKGFKEQTGKRKRSSIDESTSVKKSKSAGESSQFPCKQLKVVIKKLPQDIVNNHLRRNNLPRTPTRKQLQQVYLHGKKVNLFIPRLQKSPEKRLFPETFSLLSSPTKGNDEEAENLLNVRETQETTQPESDRTTAEEMSFEKADDDNYLLDTFLDEGIEDDNAQQMALKETSEKMEERNPLQGLFEKSEELQDGDKKNEEELQDEEKFELFTSPYDALRLFSPASFFGDEGSTEINEVSSSPDRTAEMDGNKREQQEKEKERQDKGSVDMEEKSSGTKKNHTGRNSSSKVDTENSKRYQEGRMSSELKQAVKSNAVISDQTTVPHADPKSSTLDFVSSERTELQQDDEGSGNITCEPPISSDVLTSRTVTTHQGLSKENNEDLQHSSHCFTTDTESTVKVEIDAPLSCRKANKEDQVPPETCDYTASENMECHKSSASSVPPLSSQNSELLNVPTVSQSNTFASLSFPDVLQALELAAKESAGNGISVSLSQEPLGRKELSYTNTAVQQLSSVATPQLQSLSVQNFRMTALTGAFGSPQIPRPLDSLLGPSTQVPLQSLPGNVSNPGFPVTNGTYDTPMVSLPGNRVSNTPLPPGLQPVTGNFSTYSSHPVYHGTNNVLSTDLSSTSLTGPYTNTNSLRNVSNGPMKAVPHLVQNAIQQATQMFRQPHPRPQLPPFAMSHTNVGLRSPYPYQGMTNNLMLPTSIPSLPSTTGIQAGLNHRFVKAAIVNNQPYFLTNQPSRELLYARQHPSSVTSQSVPGSANLSSVKIPTANHYPPSATGKPTIHSVPSTNPSTIGAPVYYPSSMSSQLASPSPVVPPTARHYIPSMITRHPISQSLQNPNPSLKAPTTNYYPPSATGQPMSQSFTGTNLSSVGVPTTICYPPSATGQPISQSFTGTNLSSVEVPTTICYPPSATGQPMSQSFTGTNLSSVQVPTTSCYPPSATGQPISQSFTGTNRTSVGVPTTNCYPPSATGQPMSQSFTGTNLSSVGVPTTSCYPPSATGQPMSQSFAGTNLSSVGVPTTSCYPPSATGQPMSQSFTGTNLSSVGVPTTSCYTPSATGQPISQSFTGTNLSSVEVPTTSCYTPSAIGQPISQNFVGTNPSPVKVPTMIGQASQSLPLTSQPQGTMQTQTSLDVPTGFTAVSPIQNPTSETIPESNNIPTDSVKCNNNVGGVETTSELNNNNTDTVTCNDNNVADFETTTEAKNPPPKNPLAKTTLHFLYRCETLSTETRLHIRNKLAEMLRKRRQRLAITQKDINELEELVGAEIKNDIVFQDLIKLIAAEPVLNSENSISGDDDGDDDVTIIDQPSEKSSIPTSESSMVNNQAKSDAASHTVVGRKLNPSLPKPGVRVTKIQGMTILLWDIPTNSDIKLIKEYELYAIQLEANQKLTKDLIKSMTWRKIGNVKALPPPMAITLTNLVQGFKNYMIVRGVGEDGCAGPFSYICEVLES